MIKQVTRLGAWGVFLRHTHSARTGQGPASPLLWTAWRAAAHGRLAGKPYDPYKPRTVQLTPPLSGSLLWLPNKQSHTKGPAAPNTQSRRGILQSRCAAQTAGPLGNKCTFQPFGYKQSYNQMLKPPFSISHGIYIPIQTFYKKSLRHCRNWTLLLWTEWWSPNSDCCCCPVAQLCPTLCDPMDCSMPGFSALLHLQSLLKLMSIESVMHSNHLVLCCPLLLLPSIFPSIRIFSNESALHIRWPKYWSFSISPSNECSGLISFRIDWFDFPAVQWTLNSLLQHHSSKFRYWSPNSPMSKG